MAGTSLTHQTMKAAFYARVGSGRPHGSYSPVVRGVIYSLASLQFAATLTIPLGFRDSD